MTTIPLPSRAPAPPAARALVLRDDASLVLEDDAVVVRGPAGSFRLRRPAPGVRDALLRLAERPCAPERFAADVDEAARGVLRAVLDRARPLLAEVLLDGDGELLRLERTSAGGTGPAGPPAAPGGAVRLSRFALLRTRGDRLVLESPLSGVRAVLTSARARALVAGLAAPQEPGALAAADRQVVDALLDAGLVEAAGEDSGFPSETDPVLRQWDYHDLLAHGRVRSGSFDEPLGALYPYRGSIAPRPAVRRPPRGPTVPLHRPAWDEVAARDPSLTAALEGRRSVRHHGPAPLTVAQLGEFLWRVHRVRAHYVPGDDPDGDGADEAVSRPYPSGGRAYELELYLTVSRCAGLDPGVYYYDPVAHGLVLVEDDPVPREALLGVARRAVGSDVTPDVLVTVTSRFQRLSWKYRAIAYATTLRHTGVLYQTMYLVGTAMGLGACALGNGDAALSARVLGLNYLEESSVGDFLLGSRPDDDALPDGPHPGWHLVNGADWPRHAAAQLP